jgi:hypothetical protein
MGNRILIIAALVLLSVAAWGQTRPEMTVQLADVRDAEGNFTGWTDLSVFWFEEPVAAPRDPQAVTTRVIQNWVVPDLDTGLYWKFRFVRVVEGEYAIRVCFGSPTQETLWSEITVMAILRPARPLPQ